MVGLRVYLDESSMEKNTYSPESTIPSCSAAKRISLMVVELAHITTTETKEKKKRKPVYLRSRLFSARRDSLPILTVAPLLPRIIE